STRAHSGRATRREVRSRSRAVSHSSSSAIAGSVSSANSQSGDSKIMPAPPSYRRHAETGRPQPTGDRQQRGRAHEHGVIELAITPERRKLDLGLLELVDAIEDVPQRSGIGRAEEFAARALGDVLEQAF